MKSLKLKKHSTKMMMALLMSAQTSFLLVSCAHEKKSEAAAENFPVTTPQVADAAVEQDYVAEIQALQNVELRSRVKGYLDHIYVDEGKTVQQGQPLFSISSQEYQEELTKASAELKSAIADVKTAEVELTNTKLLVDKNVVAQTELDLAQAKLDALKAKVDEATANESAARLNLSYTVIKAPFDGIINRIPYKAGSLIDEGTLLTTISNDKQMYAYFNVSEEEYLNFQKDSELNNNTQVSLVLADNQVYPLKGVIETVEGEIDKSTGNIAFRARFDNPNQILKHGASGKILITKTVKNAIMIPQKSTVEVQEKTYVYVVDKNNVVQMRSITPKARLENSYIVESGLQPTDRIVYEGLLQLKDGEKIVPKTIAPELAESQQTAISADKF